MHLGSEIKKIKRSYRSMFPHPRATVYSSL